MKLIGLIFILVCSFSLVGQIGFYKQFTDNGYDYGEGIVETADTTYFVTGASSSFMEGPSQAYLLKLDKLGNFVWSKHYGGAESDGGKRIMYIENDGILIAGFTNSMGNGAYDFYLTKTDVEGNQLWEEAYGTSSWDRVYDAALTRDSGVIMVGETLNTTDGESDILIVRTDKNGGEVWSQQIGGAKTDLATCIEFFNDSIFIVGGTTYVEDSLKNKGLMIKIEDNGTIWSMDTVGVVGDYLINAISVVPTSINVVGRLIKMDGDTSNFQQKYNILGDFQWEFSDNNEGQDFMKAIVPFGSSNRFLLASTYYNSSTYGKFDIGFQQYVNELYYEQNVALVNYADVELVGELIPTHDNGAIGVGSILRTGDGGSNVFVVKMYEGQPYVDYGLSFDAESLVSLNEQSEMFWKAFPNPTSGELRLTFDTSVQLNEIQIFDQIGREVMVTFVSENSTEKVLDLSGLTNGIYQLMAIINGVNMHRTICVSH